MYDVIENNAMKPDTGGEEGGGGVCARSKNWQGRGGVGKAKGREGGRGFQVAGPQRSDVSRTSPLFTLGTLELHVTIWC